MQTRAVADVDADEARRAHDEEARLQALSAYAILDTEPELAFDRITSLASRLFRVPIALVSLVDERRQWFKSCIGLDVREASRDVAFCAHAIRQKTPFVVHDARTDARFMDNPWVTGAPRIRFYAGAPLITRSGFCVGTLCILDRSPREMSVDELATLTDLSALVMDELDLRVISQNLEQRSRELADQTSILGSVLESAGEGIIVADAQANVVLVNPAAEAMAGIRKEQGPLVFPLAHHVFRSDQVTALRQAELPLVQAVHGLATDKIELFVRNDALPNGAFLSVTGRPIRDPMGQVRGGVITFNDITEMKRAREKLEQLASTDPLTGLANQRALRERLALLVAEGARGRHFAAVLLDIDHFKLVNDSHGHLCGDEVIKRVAHALRGRVRSTDLVARYGGEEFCVLLTDVESEPAAHVADELRKVVASIERPVRVTASFGLCTYSRTHDSVESLLAGADQALYRAKREGRNRVVVHAESPPRAASFDALSTS